MTLLTDFLPRAALAPLSVEQYHAMIRNGILNEGESLELIDGLLVRKDRRDQQGDIKTVGPRHAKSTKLLVRTLNRLLETLEDVYVQSQLPVTLSEHNEPEPDIAVILGDESDDSGERHPEPPAVRLVIEIADSSLTFDRTSKLRMYAEAGIPEYWIVNLVTDRLEIYRDPRQDLQSYQTQVEIAPADSVNFELCGQSFQFEAREVLT